MTEFQFIISIAHILTCESLSELEKLDCIRIRYRQYAFPEKQLCLEEQYILGRIL